MKKKLSLVLCALLTGFMIVGLCACGSSSNKGSDAIKGTYKASKVSLGGIEMTAKEIDMENFVLDFDGAGKLTITIDGESASVDYKLDGSTVTFDIEGTTSTGKLSGTTLTFEDIMNYGIAMTFEKQ